MPGPSDSWATFKADIESKGFDELKSNVTKSEQYQQALVQAVGEVQEALQKGETASQIYSNALNGLLSVAKQSMPVMAGMFEVITDNLDPQYIHLYEKEALQMFSRFAGVNIDPIISQLEMNKKLDVMGTNLQKFAKSNFDVFWGMWGSSSDPVLQGIYRNLQELPNAVESGKLIQSLIDAVGWKEIPHTFWKMLTSKEGMAYAMKELSKIDKAKGVPEFEKTLGKIMTEGTKKHFWPEFTEQGFHSGNRLAKFWRKLVSKWGTTLSTAVGFALADTVRIVTRGVTDVFEPLLEALSYFVGVALQPLQVALLSLFEVVRPSLIGLTDTIGRIVYGLLPLFRIALGLLNPVIWLVTKAFQVLEFVLWPITKVLDFLVNILSGRFLSSFGTAGEIVDKIADRLSWLRYVFESLGWVLGVFLLPLMLHWSWVLGVKVVGAVYSLIASQIAMIKKWITLGALWLFETGLISGNTLAYIKNFQIRTLLSAITGKGLVKALQKLWKYLVLDRIETIKGTIAKFRSITASKLQVIEMERNTAVTNALTLAQTKQRFALGKLGLAMSALGGIAILGSAIFSDWSTWTDVFTNSLMILAGVVIPLLSYQIKGLTVAVWLARGAWAALNFVLNMGPLGWIITAIGVLVGLVITLYHWVWGGSPGLIPAFRLFGEVAFAAFSIIMFPIRMVIQIVQLLWKGMVAFATWIKDVFSKYGKYILIAMGPIGWAALAIMYLISKWDDLKKAFASGSSFIGGVLNVALLPLKWMWALLSSVTNSVVKLASYFTVAFAPLKWIGAIISWIWGGITKLFSAIKKAPSWVKNALLLAFGPLGWLIYTIKTIIQNWDKLKATFMKGVDAIRSAFSFLFEGFRRVFGGIVSFIQGMISRIPKPIRWLLGLGGGEAVSPPEIDQSQIKSDLALTHKTIQAELGKMDAVSQRVVGVPENTEQRNVSSQVAASWGRQGRVSGEAVVSSFAEGQQGKIKLAAAATEQVVSKTAEYLPHSDAEKGPLSRLVDSGSSFVKAFVSGLSSQKGILEESIKAMFANLIGVVPAPMPSVVSPKVQVAKVDMEMEGFKDAAQFSEPIVTAISGQTLQLIAFLAETIKLGKDLDISDLDSLSRFDG